MDGTLFVSYFYCYFTEPFGHHGHVLIYGIHLMKKEKTRHINKMEWEDETWVLHSSEAVCFLL